MIRIERHPLVRRDLRELARYVAEVSGDPRAAERRLDQVEALLTDILANPTSGTILSPELPGWRVRHGGSERGELTMGKSNYYGGGSVVGPTGYSTFDKADKKNSKTIVSATKARGRPRPAKGETWADIEHLLPGIGSTKGYPSEPPKFKWPNRGPAKC